MRPLLLSARVALPALVLGLVAAAFGCEDKARPWGGKDGPPAALSPPPPGATNDISDPPEGPAALEVDVDAAAPPSLPPSIATAPASAAVAVGGALVVPGGGWVRCAEGLGLSGDPLKDVTRIGVLCGPSNGMRRKTRQAIVGLIGEHDPPVATQLQLQRGACYRVFAVADAQVAELDVTVRSSHDVAVARDHAVGRLAVVQTDRPFCTFADDLFTVEVAARRGSGRFAAEVWSLGEPVRRGEALEGPADEGPIEKP